MLQMILGESGTGKSYALMEELRRQLAAGRKVFAIIPDQFSFEFDKKLYKILGCREYHKVQVYSFTRLAREIFRIYGGKSGVYAEEAVKTSLMYLAVKSCRKEKAFSFWDKQSASVRFVPEVLSAVKDFQLAGVTPEFLAEKLPFVHEGVREKLSDLSMVYTAYQRLLGERRYKDTLAELGEAAEIAAREDFFAGAAVFVDEFRSFTKEEYAFLNSVLSGKGDLFVALTLERSSLGKDSLFAVGGKTYAAMYRMAKSAGTPFETKWLEEQKRFLGKDIAHISRNIFRPRREKARYHGDFFIDRFNDPYEEIDFVAGEISRLVREENYTYKEIAVVSRNLDSYGGILESTLSRCGIPFFMDQTEPVAHKALIILVMSALCLAASKEPDTEELLKYAKTGLAGISWEEASELENYCYRWNVDGEFWLSPFPEESGNAEEIRKRLLIPILHLKERSREASGKQLARSVYELLLETGTQTILEEAPEQGEEIFALRELKQLWNMLMYALDILAEVLGDERASLSDFRELLGIILAGTEYAVPPQQLDAVILSAAERGRLSEPRAVFVIGINEGIFPASVKTTGLFSDRDLAALEEAGMEISFSLKDKVAEERFIVYQALSAPSERLYLTCPMSGAGGDPLFPSFVLEQVRGMFEDYSRQLQENLIFYCPTKEAAYYQYVRNAQRNNSETASIRAALEQDPWYRERISELDKLSSAGKYRLSDPQISKKLFGEHLTVSPSRFEDFMQCPFLYFCKKGLGLYAPKKIEMNPSEQGNLIHYCLCSVLETLSKEKFLEVSKEELALLVKKSAEEYYAKVWGGKFGKPPSFLVMLEKLAETVTRILLHLQKEFKVSEFVPRAFELKIEEDGSCKPRRIVSPGGHEIRFVGTVDRVDAYEKEGKTYLRVVDYKSGTKEFALADLLYGLNMQMLLYLFTVSENEKLFSKPVSAGILYLPSKDPLPELHRTAGEEELLKKENANYKMKGLLIDDPSVLDAMEKDVAGVFLPIRKKAAPKGKKGQETPVEFTPGDFVISEKSFTRLKAWTDKLLSEMADDLAGGRIEASPLKKKNSMPCDYCDYWSVCGKNYSSVREYAPDAKEQVKRIMKGEEKGDKVDE